MISEKTWFEPALGTLLTSYKSDLQFLKQFNLFKQDQLSIEAYLKPGPQSFPRFLYEYGVARNIAKGAIPPFLATIKTWIFSDRANDVDALGDEMCARGFTHGKTMTSLCSKVLFLNAPCSIIPIDRFARKALSYHGNHYKTFNSLLQRFKEHHIHKIRLILESNSNQLKAIEEEIDLNIEDMQCLRENRYVDHLLLRKGKHNL